MTPSTTDILWTPGPEQLQSIVVLQPGVALDAPLTERIRQQIRASRSQVASPDAMQNPRSLHFFAAYAQALDLDGPGGAGL